MKGVYLVLGLLLAAGGGAAQQYTISTVAGTGTVRGWFGDGGPAINGQLDDPLRVAVDSKGNFYIVDFYTYVIREVTTDGVIHTVAGSLVGNNSGGYGYSGDGGAATEARISYVHGIAVDSSGNLYIADTDNVRVRRVDSTGKIMTFAGNGNRGYAGDGAAAINAQLSLPGAVAVDGGGNVYIADYGNSTVRKVATNGNISTFAGTGTWGFSGDGGPANKAALGTPYALAVDAAGSVYISDTGNLNIRKVTPDGNIQTLVSGVDAESIAVDAAGNIYYPNYVNSTIQKISPSGTQMAIAGNFSQGFSGDGGAANLAQLNQPYGVALDSAGRIYVADSGNQVIRLLTPVASSGGIVNAASGSGGAVSPGEIIVIYGSGMGPSTLTVNQPLNGVYGTQLAGTVVSFDSTNAPILYTSDTQVAAIVPYGAAPGTTPTVTVSYQGNAAFTAPTPIAYWAPGIFTANSTGSGQAAAVNQNGTLNSLSAPAPLGTFISLYATGEGQTNPGGINGKIASTPLPAPNTSVHVTIGGQPAPVTYAGAAPGSVAGLMQVNVQIPANLVQTFSSGPVQVPVVMQVGFTLSPTVTIAVSAN